jgi:hypothetical protein
MLEGALSVNYIRVMKEHAVTTLRSLLEADARLRDLERAWKEHGTLSHEYAYHREHLRVRGYVELTMLSTKFTRWKEARNWFKKLNASGRWAAIIYMNGKPMHQVLPSITSALESQMRSKGKILIEALGWRSYQVPGFNLYFTFQPDPSPGAPEHMDTFTYQMCGSLWARGSQISVQSVNRNCDFDGSYGITGSQSGLHQDAILLSATSKATWDAHIRGGKQ